MKTIILAGGCFWGVEAYFKQLMGVIDTTVGYIDGNSINPTYKEVCDEIGHAEAVEIKYDENLINLEKLLDHYFRVIDPTSLNKQGPDKGIQYRTGIYYNNDGERDIIQMYIKKRQNEYNKPIVVKIKRKTPFYSAEEYHQDYLEKNRAGYCHINLNLVKNDEKK